MYSLTMTLKTGKKECLYEQIYEYIKMEIKEGRLSKGEKLPSTRSLAEQLQISRSTVDYAYSQLLDEGYIEARPKRGYFICEMEQDFGKSIQEQAGRFKESEQAAIQAENTVPPFRYDLSPYAVSMEYFPFSVWKKITKNILTESNATLFSHGERQGDYALRETICKYLHSSRGVNCSPEQIVVGAGNDYLLLLLEKIFAEMKTVALQNPTYPRAGKAFASFGWKLRFVEGKKDGLDVLSWPMETVDLIYVMPSHQFPTGEVMSATNRSRLLAWAAAKENRYIIEDDYDSEFRYRGKPIPALQGSDRGDKVIYIGTFSKAIAPAIRISYMVLPKSLLPRYREKCGFYSCTVSRIDQRIVNEFIRDGYFERYLNKMRKVYRAKHQLMLDGLSALEKKYQITGENAGLHFVLTAKGEISETEILEKGRKVGVKLYGMSEYSSVESIKKSSVLVGFGGLSDSEIKECTRLLTGILA